MKTDRIGRTLRAIAIFLCSSGGKGAIDPSLTNLGTAGYSAAITIYLTRRLVGATQIVSGQGKTLVARGFREGEGIICIDLEWDSNNRKKGSIPQGYWIADLPESYVSAWNFLNPLGNQYYRDIALERYRSAINKELDILEGIVAQYQKKMM